MIEEIQALMPLLEQLTDGALYGLIIYMVWSFMMQLIWPVVWVVILLKGFNLSYSWLMKSKTVGIEVIDETWLNSEGLPVRFLGDADKIKQLLSVMRSTDGFVHQPDVARATRILKEAKEENKL